MFIQFLHFVCRALIEVQVLVQRLTGSRSGSEKFAKAICAEVFDEHAYFYE